MRLKQAFNLWRKTVSRPLQDACQRTSHISNTFQSGKSARVCTVRRRDRTSSCAGRNAQLGAKVVKGFTCWSTVHHCIWRPVIMIERQFSILLCLFCWLLLTLTSSESLKCNLTYWGFTLTEADFKPSHQEKCWYYLCWNTVEIVVCFQVQSAFEWCDCYVYVSSMDWYGSLF